MVRGSAGAGRLATGAALAVGATASATLTIALVDRAVASSMTPLLRIDDVVELGVVALGVVAAAWLALSCAVGALCLGARVLGTSWRSGEAVVQRYAPAVVRRALSVGAAASLAVGLASGAGAVSPTVDATPAGPDVEVGVVVDLGWVVSDPAPVTPRPAHRTADASDDLGWVVSAEQPTPDPAPTPPPSAPDDVPTADQPERSRDSAGDATTPAPTPAADPPAPASPPHRPAAPSPEREATAKAGPADVASVVVRSGDSLWTIAEACLAAEHGTPPSVKQVAAAWPAWYAANAAVIGADPDVIRPGQHLVVPSSTERARG